MTRQTDLAEAFSDCGAFCRDTTLPPEIIEKYKTGTVFYEPTFCDASYKLGGFAAPHRYLIFSANALCLDEVSQSPEWGLCIWPSGTLFKVIGRIEQASYAQISLLEIPKNLLQFFISGATEELEKTFMEDSRTLFEDALQQPALPELSTQLWLDRLKAPLGIDDNGEYFDMLVGMCRNGIDRSSGR